MTREQIAELRRACTDPNVQPFVDFKEDVLRLLDEREALLAALRLCFHIDPNEAEAARDAAIAKGES